MHSNIKFYTKALSHCGFLWLVQLLSCQLSWLTHWSPFTLQGFLRGCHVYYHQYSLVYPVFFLCLTESTWIIEPFFPLVGSWLTVQGQAINTGYSDRVLQVLRTPVVSKPFLHLTRSSLAVSKKNAELSYTVECYRMSKRSEQNLSFRDDEQNLHLCVSVGVNVWTDSKEIFHTRIRDVKDLSQVR